MIFGNAGQRLPRILLAFQHVFALPVQSESLSPMRAMERAGSPGDALPSPEPRIWGVPLPVSPPGHLTSFSSEGSWGHGAQGGHLASLGGKVLSN